ncbi:hypothetical protein J4474_01160 [Candidatus Pacearchaeota archaeon]|nr:hypothetical protein [Candidatus Pacearchaeota archaeon]
MGIIQTFDVPGCETYLEERVCEDTGADYKVLTCKLGGHEYSFNVDWVKDKDKLEWLATVYGGTLVQVRKFAQRDTQEEINKNLDGLLKSLGRSLQK